MQIFGEKSPVKLIEFFDREIKTYSDLIPYFPKLEETDIPLLESVRDWNGKVKILDRLDFLDQYLDLPRVKYMDEEWNEDLVQKVAGNGDLEVLKYLRSKNCSWNRKVCLATAEMGHLEVLKYLIENGCPFEGKTCDEKGLSHCGRYTFYNTSNYRYGRCTSCDMELHYAVAKNGHTHILEYLHDAGHWRGNFELFIQMAVMNRHLSCVKYLHEHRLCEGKTEEECSSPKLLEYDEYFDEKGVCMIFAAENGDLECLKYLRSCGYTFNEQACEAAARGGHFDCLKYLHTHGCLWAASTVYATMNKRSMECLKYAIENGCEFGPDSLLYCSIYCWGEAMEYLIPICDEGYEGDYNYQSYL